MMGKNPRGVFQLPYEFRTTCGRQGEHRRIDYFPNRGVEARSPLRKAQLAHGQSSLSPSFFILTPMFSGIMGLFPGHPHILTMTVTVDT